MKHTIKVLSGKKTYTIYGDEDKNLLEILSENGFIVEAACGGAGTCGKCKIRVSGNVTPKTEQESKLLSDADDLRLACRTYPRGDVSIWIDGHVSCASAPVFKSGKTEIFPNIEIKNTPALGIAFDIGTTGITAALYDLASGIKLKEICDENTGRVFGADIISRISYSIKDEESKTRLTDTLRGQLNSITAALHKKKSEILYITVAANTALLHFLTGKPVNGLAQAPYTPDSTFGFEVDACDIGINCKNAKVYLLPAISGYVGADITAGLIAARFHKKNGFSLFVDIGTNGEMAAGGKDGITCCSTAAGPAFEGAGLSCGMPARPGAINYIDFENGRFKIETISGTEPVGICGSGIIDVIAMLVRYRAVDTGGRLLPRELTYPGFRDFVHDTPDGVVFHITDKVYVTANDVRTIQLAKAAIRAGMDTLLTGSEKSYDDVRALYLAGAFGSLIRSESAAAIGLIPPELLTRVVPVGNSSAAGAAGVLLSRRVKSQLKTVLKKTRSIELSGDQTFFNNYIDAMSFE